MPVKRMPGQRPAITNFAIASHTIMNYRMISDVHGEFALVRTGTFMYMFAHCSLATPSHGFCIFDFG